MEWQTYGEVKGQLHFFVQTPLSVWLLHWRGSTVIPLSNPGRGPALVLPGREGREHSLVNLRPTFQQREESDRPFLMIWGFSMASAQNDPYANVAYLWWQILLPAQFHPSEQGEQWRELEQEREVPDTIVS